MSVLAIIYFNKKCNYIKKEFFIWFELSQKNNLILQYITSLYVDDHFNFESFLRHYIFLRAYGRCLNFRFWRQR